MLNNDYHWMKMRLGVEPVVVVEEVEEVEVEELEVVILHHLNHH
jgi:hypothetical protein